MKLLDKNGFSILLQYMNNKFVKNGEIVLSAPAIIHKIPTDSQLVLENVSVGQYVIIDNTVRYINIKNIESLADNNQHTLYVQFKSSDQGIKLEFDNIILWKSGTPLVSEPNKLYRIEIIKCGNIFIGKWFSWTN